MEFIAHIKENGDGSFEIQTLEDHLEGTSQLAEKFSGKFNNPEWGRILGLWHDIGKYSAEFQRYIKINSGYEEEDQLLGKVDHSSVGAVLARELLANHWPPIAYVIAGHHAGLLNFEPEIGISGELKTRLGKLELLEKVKGVIPEYLKLTNDLNPPCGKQIKSEHMHLWIRMLFSCLVDADFLDTERFMNPDSFSKRGIQTSVEELKGKLDEYLRRLTDNVSQTKVNQIRQKILEQCLVKAYENPGFFTLNVPTGGGKTLSSLAWALNHAQKFKKERIVIAIPYTSIIAQTAKTLREIFGESNVIEHHSNIDDEMLSSKSKLAVENWDAPIVITTNVQLFESLFSSRTSKCRKLHNLVNSVIILDEAQVLPPDFLQPILEVLKGLVENFNVSVLFSTATQPVVVGEIGSGYNKFCGVDMNQVIEITENVAELASAFRRVKLVLPELPLSPVDLSEIATELQNHQQVLCIVNTRKECRELYRLMPEDTLHLSRLMCSAHIMEVIEAIKTKLKNQEPVRVISTQLVEAGVDIDFPVVFREMAGLDSIAQSAGRCNREGKMNQEGKLGLTKVFYTGKIIPPGLMRKGTDTMRELLSVIPVEELLDPVSFKKYFNLFYSKVQDFDKPKCYNLLIRNAMEMRFQFATCGRDFKLIDDQGSQNISVLYMEGVDLIRLLKEKGPESWLMRKLQRYSVSVNDKDFQELKKSGHIEQVHGCWIQADAWLYNKRVGLVRGEEWMNEVLIA